MLESWGEQLGGKLALIRMDKGTAASYANYAAGMAPHLTQLARSRKELELSFCCAVVALHIAGEDNSVADALSRFAIRARGLGPYPERGLRRKYRAVVNRLCGAIDVDMLASDDGRYFGHHPTSATIHRPPSNVRCRLDGLGGFQGLIWRIRLSTGS